MDGMSMYATLRAARQTWDSVRQMAEKRHQFVKVGYYVAEVNLVQDAGFLIEDLDEDDGHLTVWGEPNALALSVSEIYAAPIEPEYGGS
jgi:hypothetical protein